MRRVLLCIFFALLTTGRAAAWTELSDEIKAVWGVTGSVQEAWGSNHPAATTPFLKNKKAPANSSDEAIVMVYMAREVVPHGGYFCATQLRSRNRGGNKNDAVWTQYQEVSGGASCYWLCAPGYSGAQCVAATAGDNCDATVLSKETIISTAGYREGGGYDDSSIEASMDGKAYLSFGYQTDKNNESDVILVAKTFTDHSIMAYPVTFSAFCGNWNETNGGKCDKGESNLKLVDNGGKTIKLCMKGYSGPDCAIPASSISPTCGQCPDGENFHDGQCIKCKEGELFANGRCFSCIEGKQKLNSAKDGCEDRKSVARSALSAKGCMSKFDSDEYKTCVLALPSEESDSS
jgi:hypothetical protein